MTERDPLDGYEPHGLPPDVLTPTPRRGLEELLTGEQISRLVYLTDRNRYGGAQAALKLRSGLRMVLMAAPGPYVAYARRLPTWPYRYAIVMDLWEAMTIVTPRMERELTQDRHRVGQLGADDVQQRVEGEVVLGAPSQAKPTSAGGEQVRLDLTGDLELWFTATSGIGACTAGLDVEVRDVVGRQVIVMVGGRKKR